MIEALQDICSHSFIEFYQVDHHACVGINGAPRQHFDRIVMAMPVRVIAFAISHAIFFGREGVAMQTVARTQHVAPAEVGCHASPLYSAKISGVSYTRILLS